MRIATWDVGPPPASPERRARQRLAVERAGADVVVLTGAATSLVPAGHDAVTTASGGAGAHDLVLAAHRLRPLAVPELASAAAAVVDDARLVVGVRLAPGPEDLRTLDSALARLRDDAPHLPLVLAGGFGQTLTGHVVGSRVGRVLLEALLRRHGLTAHTARSPSARAGCASVDHVCSSTAAAGARTWSSVDAEAEVLLSDSLGYVVEL